MHWNRLFLVLLALMPLAGQAAVNVVASTSDLAWFAREIGGDLVNVEAIASPLSDPHFVEVRPSYMIKVKRADVVLKIGMELDLWMDQIIDGSRNGNLRIIDCSANVSPMEVPSFKADARYGDLHRFGNPHYWLGPDNAAPIARSVMDGLAAADPDHADIYRRNCDSLLEIISGGIEQLRPDAAGIKNKEIIFYHNSWPYFCRFAGITAAGFIEPYPGVTPSPGHIKEIIDLVKARGIKIIAVEPYFDRRVPEKIALATGARVVTLYPSIGGRENGESYLDWLRYNIDILTEK